MLLRSSTTSAHAQLGHLAFATRPSSLLRILMMHCIDSSPSRVELVELAVHLMRLAPWLLGSSRSSSSGWSLVSFPRWGRGLIGTSVVSRDLSRGSPQGLFLSSVWCLFDWSPSSVFFCLALRTYSLTFSICASSGSSVLRCFGLVILSFSFFR